MSSSEVKYAAKPPPGVVPDYDNPARNGVSKLFIIIPLLMAIATIMVLLRLYTRRFIVKKLGADDCKLTSSTNVRNAKLMRS